MDKRHAMITARFRPSGETVEVRAEALIAAVRDFLDFHGTAYLLGESFARTIGNRTGAAKLERLLAATGFAGDPEGFVRCLVGHLEAADSRNPEPLRLNGIEIPQMSLMAVSAHLLPGAGFKRVADVARLERLINARIPPEQREALQEVIDTYPVRLSPHIIRQMRVSSRVACQYLPFVEELDPAGHVNTWVGRFHQGLLERMYRNRVIFLLNMSCPVYCRFCFRKHKASRNEADPEVADVVRAVARVAASPSVKEILITGGDPFLNRRNLAAAIDGLKEIDHVQCLRLATRSVAYHPDLFLADDGELLEYLKLKNLELQRKGKRLELATHLIHPDEVSPECLSIIAELVGSGIPVYVQTPFLKDCNDRGPELVRLFHLLRGAGAELHYIYIPCSPIHGNGIYRTDLSEGHQVANHLRAHLSDRGIPRICTATPVGKLDWNTSGWAVGPDPEDENFLWLRTPYTPSYFKSFAPLADGPDDLRINAEGTIDVRYMARIGDEALYLGERPAAGTARSGPAAPATLDRLHEELARDLRNPDSVVATGLKGVCRSHRTRVEIEAGAGPEALDFVARIEAVTDVVVSGEPDVTENLSEVAAIVARLRAIDHVNAVRLCSPCFARNPERYSRTLIERLGALNHLIVARPLRLEIETQFLHADELRPVHRRLVRRLNNRGITVYADTPLVVGVNDTPAACQALAYGLRAAGIEFHHLYVAGLPLQQRHNAAQPVDVADILDIATAVRREGSGREIPRYIVRTPLGEVDFGLTSRLRAVEGGLQLRLLPYDSAYFRELDPDYRWPEGVREDEDGVPVWTVPGLASRDGFMVR